MVIIINHIAHYQLEQNLLNAAKGLSNQCQIQIYFIKNLNLGEGQTTGSMFPEPKFKVFTQ